MGRGSDDTRWPRRCGALTAVRDDDLVDGNLEASAAAAAHLIAVARAVALRDDQSELGAVLGPAPQRRRARQLAEDLAREGPSGPAAKAPRDDLATAYLDALEQAAHAVYHCRRVRHASGECWFAADGPGRDLCGQVLLVAHALRPQASPGPVPQP